MKISPIVLILIGFALGVAATCRWTNTPQPTTSQPLITTHDVEIIYDTVTIHDIPPTTIVPIESNDAITTSPLNLYTFEDTIAERWSAEIIGRDVELKSLTLHNRIEKQQITKYYPPRWQLTTQMNIGNITQWVGVVATHNRGGVEFSAHLGYNPMIASVVYGASIGVRLWSRY